VCLAITGAFLFFVLLTIVIKGLPRFDLNLITNQPSKINPGTAGVQSAILGTLWVIAVTTLIALPLASPPPCTWRNTPIRPSGTTARSS